MDSSIEPQATMRNVRIAWIFIAGGGLLFGYIIGINSNIIITGQLLCPDEWTGSVGSWTSSGYDQCYKMTALDKGLFSALSLIGAVISSLTCFRYGDTFGRKLEVRLAATFYLLGAVCAAASPVLWGVYLSIIVYGLGIGFSMHAAPAYIAEISPADARGTLVAAKEAVVVFGIFLGFLSGFVFSSMGVYGWRFGILVSGVFALIMEIGIIFIPQSPRFLVLKAVRSGGLLGAQDRPMNEAREALMFFRQAHSYIDIEEELQEIYEDASELQWHDSEVRRVATIRSVFSYPRPLLIGCGVVFFSQITGQPSVLYFATDIFQDAGFGAWASLPSVGVGLVGLLATLFTVCQVDKYGRRTLLFVGITMMAIALAVLGTAFLFQECQVPGMSLENCDKDDIGLPQGYATATALALMLYCAGYQVGFGPISRLLISEVFPLNVRGAAISIAVVLNFITNIVMTLTQEMFLDMLTPSGVFFGYCGLALLSLLFVWKVVPETRGKSLEQIEGELTDRISRQQPQSKCNGSISSLSTADSLTPSFGGVFAREQGLSGICHA